MGSSESSKEIKKELAHVVTGANHPIDSDSTKNMFQTANLTKKLHQPIRTSPMLRNENLYARWVDKLFL